MRYLIVIVAACALTLYPLGLGAITIHVPGDQPTIQDGINAAVSGDSVVVAPGTYNEWGINYMGKAIVVMSTDPTDPDVVASTIVDAGSSGSVFRFQSAEGPASRLLGFVITGGSSNNGGGIYCDGASPTISMNVITGNVAVGNWPDFGLGGGVCCLNSDAIIEDNVISSNTSGVGGGVFCRGSSPIIARNTIEDNSATGSDTGTGVGGGIHSNESQPIISNNTIRGNRASQSGGGMRLAYHSSSISGNVIWGNEAGAHGGGISLYSSSSTIMNNTISMNRVSSGPQAGGIGMYNSFPTIVNTVCWADSPAEFVDGAPTVYYSDIQGGWPGVGNVNADPLLFAPEIGDYRLLPGSPCVDAGDPVILDACMPPGLGTTRSDMGSFGGADNCEWPVVAAVTLTLSSAGGAVAVLGGGFLDFDMSISNYRPVPAAGDLWLSVSMPDSTEMVIPEQLLGYLNPMTGQVGSFGFLILNDRLRIPLERQRESIA